MRRWAAEKEKRRPAWNIEKSVVNPFSPIMVILSFCSSMTSISRLLLPICFSLCLFASFSLTMHRAHLSTIAGKTILPKLPTLNANFNIVLASGSPRRKELLQLMGLQSFKILVSDFAEDLDKKMFSHASDYCLHTARKKVEDVIAKKLPQPPANTIVICSDTIVVIDELILEKPQDDSDAKRMMLMLSGHTHLVHTAVTIYTNSLNNAGVIEHYASFVETSKVTFSSLQEEDIIAYIASGEGRDKAGAYGIQGLGGQLVQTIEGCYFNIMGLPINALSCKLAELVHTIESSSNKEL